LVITITTMFTGGPLYFCKVLQDPMVPRELRSFPRIDTVSVEGVAHRSGIQRGHFVLEVDDAKQRTPHPSASISVSLCVSFSVYHPVSASLYASLSVSLSRCFPIFMYPSMCLSLVLYIFLSLSLYRSMYLSPSVRLSFFMSLSLCLSVSVCVCLSVALSRSMH